MGCERSRGEEHMGEWKKHKGFAVRHGDYGTTVAYGSDREVERVINDFDKASKARKKPTFQV